MLPCTAKGFHEIKTGDALPIEKNPSKASFALGAEMKRHEMVQRGVITPPCSEWAAPMILVRKRSADGSPYYKVCTDFRGLNAMTKIPVYPFPDIKSNLSLMAGSRYFTLRDKIGLLTFRSTRMTGFFNALWEFSVREVSLWPGRSAERFSKDNGRHINVVKVLCSCIS